MRSTELLDLILKEYGIPRPARMESAGLQPTHVPKALHFHYHPLNLAKLRLMDRAIEFSRHCEDPAKLKQAVAIAKDNRHLSGAKAGRIEELCLQQATAYIDGDGSDLSKLKAASDVLIALGPEYSTGDTTLNLDFLRD